MFLSIGTSENYCGAVWEIDVNEEIMAFDVRGHAGLLFLIVNLQIYNGDVTLIK